MSGRLRTLPVGFEVVHIGNAPRECEVAAAGSGDGRLWLIAEWDGCAWRWSPDDGRFEAIDVALAHVRLLNAETFGGTP